MTGSVRRIVAGIVAVLAAFTLLVGCARTVEGTAAKAGSGDVPRNDDSERQYPNLLNMVKGWDLSKGRHVIYAGTRRMTDEVAVMQGNELALPPDTRVSTLIHARLTRFPAPSTT